MVLSIVFRLCFVNRSWECFVKARLGNVDFISVLCNLDLILFDTILCSPSGPRWRSWSIHSENVAVTNLWNRSKENRSCEVKPSQNALGTIKPLLLGPTKHWTVYCSPRFQQGHWYFPKWSDTFVFICRDCDFFCFSL